MKVNKVNLNVSGLNKFVKVGMLGLAMIPATQMLNASEKDTFQKNQQQNTVVTKPVQNFNNEKDAIVKKNDLVYRPDSTNLLKINVEMKESDFDAMDWQTIADTNEYRLCNLTNYPADYNIKGSPVTKLLFLELKNQKNPELSQRLELVGQDKVESIDQNTYSVSSMKAFLEPNASFAITTNTYYAFGKMILKEYVYESKGPKGDVNWKTYRFKETYNQLSGNYDLQITKSTPETDHISTNITQQEFVDTYNQSVNDQKLNYFSDIADFLTH